MGPILGERGVKRYILAVGEWCFVKKIFTGENFALGAVIIAILALASVLIYGVSLFTIGMFAEFGWLFIYSLLAIFCFIILAFVIGHFTKRIFKEGSLNEIVAKNEKEKE